MIRAFLLTLVVFVAALPGAAQNLDVYTIRGIEVDETADTVIEAQTAAFAAAKREGLHEMISRVTLPEDLVSASGLVIDQEAADRLTAAVDVEQETRGAGRYRGRLAIVYNPVLLREYLQTAGVPFQDEQAALALMVPVAVPGIDYAWAEVWPDVSDGRLAPFVTAAPDQYDRFTIWSELEDEVRSKGARRAVLAELVGSRGAYRVRVAVLTANRTERLGLTEPQRTLEEAADAAQELLDTAWKQTSIIRETERNAIEATVRYTSLAEWNTLRGVLARSPLVSEFSTLAVSRTGAYVRFVFPGNGERLIADLRDRGVMIRAEPIGWVLSSAASGPRIGGPS